MKYNYIVMKCNLIVYFIRFDNIQLLNEMRYGNEILLSKAILIKILLRNKINDTYYDRILS